MQTNETAPPRKRARTSCHNDSDDPSSIEKDEEFWYDDGTLILIAANVEFRVYRGPLATHSPVFRDMLALPQPPPSQSTSSAYDVSNPSPLCPTVHVTDSPVDLRHFLRAFVAGGILKPADAPTFYAVSAWIRLGHKYEVDSLVENGLQYLRRFYPSVLSDSPSCPGPIRNDRPDDVRGSHAIAIVNLARLTGSNDLLPLALLECCKLGASIVEGCISEDGTVEHLRPDDLGRCFAAKDLLVLQVVAAYLYLFELGHADLDCLDSARCQEALDDRIEVFRIVSVGSVKVDELLEHEGMESFAINSYLLCTYCRSKTLKIIRTRRKEFWKSLPRRFNVVVDGWAAGVPE